MNRMAGLTVALSQVDLLSPRLVSGLQSQGPPAALHPRDYLSYISIGVETSLDGTSWTACCGPGHTPTQVILPYTLFAGIHTM